MARRLVGRAGLLAVAVAGLVALPRPAPAQAVVVAVRSVGELLNDVDDFVGAVAPAEQAQALHGMLAGYKNPDATPGLDRDRPLVAMLWLPEKEGSPPNAVIAVPITDLNKLLDTLKGFNLQVSADAGAPGFSHKLTLPNNQTPLYVTSTAEYAFFSLMPTGAEKVKALKPEMWTQGRTGDIGLSVRLDRIPQQYKDQALAQIEQSLAAQRQQKPDEKDAEYKSRMAGMDLTVNAFKSLLNDGRDLTLELSIDSKRQDISLELSTSARPGTDMARGLQAFSARRSRFAGLGPDAALAAWLSAPMAEQLRAAVKQGIEQGRQEGLQKAQTPAEKELLNRLIDALEPTLAGEEFDIGLALQGSGPGQYTLIAGMQVRDGKKIEAALRDAVKAAKPDAKTEIQLDAVKAADGTSIHRVRSTEKADAKTAKAFGEQQVVYFAVNDRTAVASFGAGGLAAIQRALATTGADTGPAAAAPEQVALVAHAAKLADLAEENVEATKKAAAEAFPDASHARDAVRLALHGDGTTLRLRLSMEMPAVKFFVLTGAAAQAQKAGAGAPPAP